MAPRTSHQPSRGPAGARPGDFTAPRQLRLRAERQLLQVMVRGMEWVERAAELLSPQDFEDPHHRAIFETLLDDPDLRAPPSSMDPVTAKRFEEVLASDPEEVSHGIDVFTKSVNRLRALVLRRRIEELQRTLEATGNEEAKRDLANEKSLLARELREIDPSILRSAMRGSMTDHSQNEPSR